jgi:hypothetical protein
MEGKIIAGQRPLTELFHAHYFGQSTILHIQKHRVAKCNTLFGFTNRQLMWRDLAARTRPYLCVSDWPTSTYSSSLGERSARLTLRIVELCGRCREITEIRLDDNSSQLRETFMVLATDAAQLHNDLQEYFDSASAEWRPWSLPHTFPGPSPLDPNSSVRSMSNLVSTISGWGLPGGSHLKSRPTSDTVTPSCPSRIDIYPTRQVSYLWNALRCAWLHLCRSLIDLQLFAADHGLVDVACSVDLPSVEESYTALAELIEDICASVPYFLGDVDQNGDLSTADESRQTGFWLMWLLHRICAIPGLDPGLRAWIVTLFERIGNRGLKRGLFLAKLHAD